MAPRSVRFQSGSVRGVSENRSQHCPGRSRAIVAHTVNMTLQGQLIITVAKQSLKAFGSVLIRMRTEARPSRGLLQSESAWIIVHQLAVSLWCNERTPIFTNWL